MTTYQATWEDDENNRHVELVVDYRLARGKVEIENVTPQRVYFKEPGTNEVTSSVAVWTQKGRQMITQQLKASGWLAALEEHITATAVHDVVHAEATGSAAEVVPSVQA